MKRILHVIGSLNNGGSQAMVMNLYRNIDRTKVQFDFIIDREDELFFEDEINCLGGKIYILPSFNIKNSPRYIKCWNDFFSAHPEYDIIHGHVRSTASIYLKIAKTYGLTTIAHSHNTSSGKGFPALVKNILQFPLRYIADYFFACSEPAGKWLFGNKVCNQANFLILKNAIDTKKFIYNETVRNRVRDEFNLHNKFVLGHIGRFHNQKNHTYLIDIFAEVKKTNENAVLLLVGEGDLRRSIEAKVNKLGLSNSVIFAGVRSNVHELLQAMDIFVFPSLYEGLGIVVIEAQAAGLPCVVSDTIPKEAFINNTDNKIISAFPLNESAETWANAIQQYSVIKERRNMFNEIKSSGYDITHTTKQIEEFYINNVGRD